MWTTAVAAKEWTPDGQTGALSPRRGAAEAAWVGKAKLGGTISHTCRHQRPGLVPRRLQEGGSHPHRGPAQVGQVHVAQSACGPGHGHGVSGTRNLVGILMFDSVK
jgi:hypothetical protein